MLRSSRTVAALAILLVVTACDATEAGKPVASGGPVSSSIATTSASPGPSSGSPLPPRPRDLEIDGFNPCQAWTADQLTALGLDVDPVGGGPMTTATGDAGCGYIAAGDGRPLVNFFISFELDRDAADVLVPDSQGMATQVAEVAGFPAVRETGPERSLRPCLFAVSTKDGQYVEVRLDYGSSIQSGVLPLEQACERTLQAATFAMQTLQAQR